MTEPDDGLTCDPCKDRHCGQCEGGACWHECPDDSDRDDARPAPADHTGDPT
jgi:hypothetical protein